MIIITIPELRATVTRYHEAIEKASAIEAQRADLETRCLDLTASSDIATRQLKVLHHY